MAHLRWATSTHKFLFLYYYIVQQNQGIQLEATQLHFLFTLSQSISHNHKDRFYNVTIQYIDILQCFTFIKGVPWESTTGFPKPWAYKSPIIYQVMTLKLHYCTKFFSTPPSPNGPP